MSRKVLVTSALPYANGNVHIGHMAGAYLPADIYHRYLRLKGVDSVYVCGSDEHGVPITITAEKEGVTPADVIDRYHAANEAAFASADMAFDIYGRTSSPSHHALSSEFFLKLFHAGHIEKASTEQLFCPDCGRFLPDRYVEGTCPDCGAAGARGDQCDACGKALDPLELVSPRCKICGAVPTVRSTTHYFLKLQDFSGRLRSWLTAAEGWRDSVRNFALGWIDEGLHERAITRDLDWGVPVPLDEASGKVLYVWFDAPIGYISFSRQWAAGRGLPDLWRGYWQNPDAEIVHFIGKDNIPFHAITWPAMLMGVGGYNLPSVVVANEYLNFGENKFSKSRGNVIRLDAFSRVFGPDRLRFYLAATAPETQDSEFTWDDFAERVNAELVNVIGNFIYRTLSFASKYFHHAVPDAPLSAPVMAEIAASASDIDSLVERFRFRQALARTVSLARFGNRFFDDSAPWKSRSEDPAAAASVIASSIEIARALSVLLLPVAPSGASRCLAMLNASAEDRPLDTLGLRPPGPRPLGQLSIPFQKIDDAELPSMVKDVMGV
ncbi:MAG: methionine--tRNA ligase [Planctomycetes bacterium]|nr:methionine--tRNA ligase [Planctomycetota bacterium]